MGVKRGYFAGSRNPNWKGGVVSRAGYVGVRAIGSSGTYILEHRLIAERAMGKTLPPKAQIHHYGARDENDKLVICEDLAYHKLLHIRQDAYRATGDGDARKCHYCKRWGIPGDGNMVVHFRSARARGAGKARHKRCHARSMRRLLRLQRMRKKIK